MLIDWFTVIAQVINFLILVWLLKRFLYRPILNAIDAREQRIATELADADEKRAEAEQQRDKFELKNAKFDEQQTAQMNQVATDAKAERARLFEIIRLESDDLRDKLQLALKNEQLSLQEALSERVREEVFQIARKALIDLAGISLEDRITSVFIKRLQALNDEELVAFKSAFQSINKDSGQVSKNPLIVRTAFTLSKDQCAQIEAAIKDIFCHDACIETSNGTGDEVVDNRVNKITLQFVTDSDVISGIEISANGQKVAWSMSDYLASLAKGVDQILQSLPTEKGTEQNNTTPQKKAKQGSDET